MGTVRLTAAQALVRFLGAQHVERDGVRQRFFAGCFGIFGHGNVGIADALLENSDSMPYHQARNEQGMVHTAVGYARMKNRLGTFACTSSIGPGATNMVTGAALATVNRLPVLLIPGDVFVSHGPDPVLQQLEVSSAGDVSVNDAFRPVSRYFDRLSRPEQVITAALAAMRVLTSPAETGAVTLAFPQDVQTEAFDYPEEFLAERDWHVPRQPPEEQALARAVDAIRSAKRPLIVAGGGVIYSEATEALRALCEATGIPVGETQAGKGSLPYDHPSCLGAIGATGTFAANRVAAAADLVIGIGTRYSDFTTASKTAFRSADVRFVNVNVADFDAAKHSGIRVVADARVALEQLAGALAGWSVDDALPRRGGAPQRRVGRRGRAPLLPRPGAAAGAERGAGRRQRRLGARRRRGLRGRRDAGRPAQAVAHPRPEGLSRRVRLLVHGLRDRRRDRHQAGRAGARGVRARRRRLLPDAAGRARDRGAGGREADRRARRQPRLQLDRRALALGRVGRVRDAVPLRARTGSPCSTATATRRPTSRSTSPPTPSRSARW